MKTETVRIPAAGEVWYNRNHGPCYITETGLAVFNMGHEQFPSLLCHLGGIGSSQHGDSPPVLYERDGWTVFESYADFIQHRRRTMLENLQNTIREVNEFCDREIRNGKPGQSY